MLSTRWIFTLEGGQRFSTLILRGAPDQSDSSLLAEADQSVAELGDQHFPLVERLDYRLLGWFEFRYWVMRVDLVLCKSGYFAFNSLNETGHCQGRKVEDFLHEQHWIGLQTCR